jgi:hypothetical protein
MTVHIDDRSAAAARRSVFGRMAGTLVLGVSGLFPALVPSAALAQTPPSADDRPDWPGKMTGRYKQVVDAYAINGGFPLNFAWTFLATNPPASATAALILRSAALPISLKSEIWAKYRIGDAFKIIDPETKAPAVKNPFLDPKPGVLQNDAMAIDHLLSVGVIIGACNVALRGQSRALAHNAGVGADEAATEWAANLIPGITLLPSGVWGTNRAQTAGCTYCAGG